MRKKRLQPIRNMFSCIFERRYDNILFMDDANGYQAHDPFCTLVEISPSIKRCELEESSNRAHAYNRITGESWLKIITQLAFEGFESDVMYMNISKSTIPKVPHSTLVYKLISGNY